MTGRMAARSEGEQGGLAAEVRATLEHLDLQPQDQALAAVAVRYGETIDRAAAIAAQAARIPYDPDTAEEVKKLASRVSGQVTMADLGPKLLAALDALGATPKARAAVGQTPAPSGPSKLSQLRSAS
ncbi:hypothetical protein [Pseudonocardia sp. WMMC193]|uniref:terminase small subunit n=1 Tax=Pseudonocardia sp. WMMC193 TaxID=2911965 RepID=UPI001F28D208|nr:hypothetical protein [Pseudonocardia sp. WMMC193]MCF7548911.1 hypothetical protein [Pseudonocardia sp. WMMC193]